MREVCREIFVSCVILRFHTILLKGVCHHQEDVEVCKSVKIGSRGRLCNPNPTKLFIKLAKIFVIGHLVLGSPSLVSSVPRL